MSESDHFLQPIQLTDYPLSVEHLLVNRQGTALVFVCDVYPNATIEEAHPKMTEGREKFVYRFEKVFVRHWDEYADGR